jgi:hypothetical protein
MLIQSLSEIDRILRARLKVQFDQTHREIKVLFSSSAEIFSCQLLNHSLAGFFIRKEILDIFNS